MSQKPDKYELSPKELKTFKGFEDVVDDEAKKIFFQLKELSQILYSVYQQDIQQNNLFEAESAEL